jgi:hypothetical protein
MKNQGRSGSVPSRLGRLVAFLRFHAWGAIALSLLAISVLLTAAITHTRPEYEIRSATLLFAIALDHKTDQQKLPIVRIQRDFTGTQSIEVEVESTAATRARFLVSGLKEPYTCWNMVAGQESILIKTTPRWIDITNTVDEHYSPGYPVYNGEFELRHVNKSETRFSRLLCIISIPEFRETFTSRKLFITHPVLAHFPAPPGVEVFTIVDYIASLKDMTSHENFRLSGGSIEGVAVPDEERRLSQPVSADVYLMD